MNGTIRLSQAHRRTRSYKSEPIPEKILEAVIESAYRARTSTNSHEIALAVVGGGASSERIADIASSPSCSEIPPPERVLALFSSALDT
jgi:nitroreductase